MAAVAEVMCYFW